MSDTRAYVQRLPYGDRSHLSFEEIAYWFDQREYEVVRFDAPELDDGFLDRGLLRFPEETVVAGSVGTVRRALDRAGRVIVDVPSLPEPLVPWIERIFRTTTMGDVRQLLAEGGPELPVHVKPLEREKLFDGRLVERPADVGGLGFVEDAEPVLVQERVEFTSEWRAYVLRGRVRHVAHYRGDPLRFPDPERVAEGLDAWPVAPIACGMDWGITPDGRTLLVEVNDGFALGNYGLDGLTRTAMIEARWRELCGLPDNGVGA